MNTVFGDSAHEILPGVWVGDCESALIGISRDFAVLNVLETGAIPGESHIPILLPLSYRSPADGVLAYRVRLDNAVKWIEENKSRQMLVHCGAGDFLKTILVEYKIKGDKFHIAGPSNGGIASLHVAAANPQYFLSVTAFPGYMWEATEAKLEAISKMCIFMYVGEFDPYMWHDEMEGEAEYLRSLGALAQYNVEKNQPHRLETLSGANAGRLFDGFEEAQKGCRGK